MDRAGIEALHAIADPTRLRVLAALLERSDGAPPATVEELAQRTGMEPRRVERAKRQLEDAGLLQSGPPVGILDALVEAVDAAVGERPLERALRPGSTIRRLVRRGVLRRLLIDHGWLSRDPSTQVYRPTDRTCALWAEGVGGSGGPP